MTKASRMTCLLRHQGQPMTIHLTAGGTRSGWGYLQPFRTESKDYLWRQQSPLGSYEGSRFRFYGEATLVTDPDAIAWVSCLGKDYLIQELQPIYFQETLVYWWGVVTLKDPEEECL